LNGIEAFFCSIERERERERAIGKSAFSAFLASFLVLVIVFVIGIPASFAQMLASPSYRSSRFYPLALLDEGDPLAGMRGNAGSMAFMPTSQWSSLAVNMTTGNSMMLVQAVNLPGTPLPLSLSLIYNHRNSEVNVGVGEGWMSSLHTAVAIDNQTQDLVWLSPTGEQQLFEWDSGSSTYLNPYGFAGKAEVLGTGDIAITPLGQGSIIYASDGKLQRIEDKTSSGALEVSYDNGRPVALEDSLSGRSITMEWNLSGQLVEIEDPSGQVWELSYDQLGEKLLSITPPSSEASPPSLSFGYDATSGFLNSHDDLMGNTYELSYYSSGSFADWMESWTDPASISSSFSYDTSVQGFSIVTTFTDGESREITFGFNSEGYLLEQWQEVGQELSSQQLGYSTEGWLTSLKDTYQKETTLSYDSVGHLTSILGPAPYQGGTPYQKSWTYTPSNSLNGLLTEESERVTSAVWVDTVLAYNDQNHPYSPTHITNGLSQTTLIAYQSEGFVSSVTVPTTGGTKSATFSYSAITKALSGSIDFGGNETLYSYKSSGLPDQISSYEGLTLQGRLLSQITHSYNALHSLTGTYNSVDQTTSTQSYNANGAPLSSVSAGGCSSSQSYDPSTNPAQIHFGSPGYQALAASTTNSQNQTTSYTYDASGKLSEVSDYLNRDTVMSYDGFGRLESQTDPFGRTSSFSYNLNHQLIEREDEGQGITSFTYDDAGRMTEMDHPVRGTVEYSYNVRGDLLSDALGNYTYDLLGRVTSHPTEGSFSYTPDGLIQSHNSNDYAYNAAGNVTSWEGSAGTVTLGYSGAQGYTSLGLPSTASGSGNYLSSYAFSYNNRFWLSQLQVSSKGNQSFSYAWSSAGELQGITNPNNTTLSQQWSNKKVSSLTVKNSTTQAQLLGSTPSYNSNQQLEGYATVVNAGQNPPLSESFDLTYDGLNRVSTITRDSDNQVVTYSYDASTGRPSSLNLSDEGTFSFSYLSNGKLESVTYPGQQGTEDYNYDSEGKLQSIEFPDSSVLSFTRTSRHDLSSAQFTDSQNTVYRYDFTYDDQANLISSNYSIDSLQMESWSYYWGPQGLEYASRSGGQAITQNFSTDPSGRILSMTYGSASYSGELYYHYDALGNTTLLTDAGGNPKASFIYDLHSGKIIDSWNPDNLVVINLEQGIGGLQVFELPEGIKIGIIPKQLNASKPKEFKGKIPKWAEDMDFALFNTDGTPVFRIRLAFFWGPGASWCEELDTDEPPSYEFYDPNRAYMHGGGGGGKGNEKSWENYSNCVINCFAGENTAHSGRNITNKPSPGAVNKWNTWIRDLPIFKAALGDFLLGVLASISWGALEIIIAAWFTVTGLSGIFSWAGVIIFAIGIHVARKLDDAINTAIAKWGEMQIKTWFANWNKERECRSYCNKYRPA
jgi:YD repeat-containing protein